MMMLAAVPIVLIIAHCSLGNEHHLVRRQAVTDATAGCGSTKGCFRNPEGCSGSNCETAVSFEDKRTHIDFMVAAKMPRSLGSDFYVSIGFSRDSTMGSDSVIDCMRSGNTISVKASYNPGKSNQVLNNQTLGLSQMSGRYENGYLVCAFSRQKSVVATGSDAGKVYDLTSPNKYTLLVAKGSVLNGSKQMHNQAPLISPIPLDFNLIDNSDSTGVASRHHAQHHWLHGVSVISALAVIMAASR